MSVCLADIAVREEAHRGGLPRVLVVAPSIRIMGGQSVMARQLLDNFRSSGIEAEFLPINPRLPGILSCAEHIKYLRTVVVSIFYVISLLRRVPKYDIIHIFSASYFSFIISQTPAILVSRMCGKKVVLNYRSGQCDDHLTRWGHVVYGILRLVDRIVVPSQFLVEVFARHGFEAIAIPNVVDLRKFSFIDRTTYRPRILVPRMLEPVYNIECSIRAFQIFKQRVPDAKLTVLGEGPQEAYLRGLVKELELADVTFAGCVDRQRIARVYREHEILLNSSSTDNMPVSILEAFATGLPVVTTDAGGIPLIVRDRETGHLSPVNDHIALATRLLEVMTDQAATRQMVLAAKHEMRKYRWPAVARKWFDLYLDLAGAAAVPS